MNGATAVVGVGESRYYKQGQATETEFQLACIAIKAAVEDAGLELNDIDGFVSYMDRNDPNRLSAALNTGPIQYTATPFGGGGNTVAHCMALADAAVTAGYANYVVVFRSLAQGQFGRFGQARMGTHVVGNQGFTAPFGLGTPAQTTAIQTKRFMEDHGVTQSSLCEISLASYTHAQHNPRAVRYGRGITREDYYNSRWITEPFHLFDCCQENDGAAAVIVTTAERARALKKPPVYIKAAAIGIDRRAGAGAFNEPDFPLAGFKHAGQQLWKRAGVGPKDVDVAQFYENFTGPVLIAMAEMGICKAEELDEFTANGNLQWPNGKFPINTSGANLAEAYIHGLETINEAVRQVRGESTCQVKDVELSLQVSGPGFFPGSTILFSKEPR